MIDISLQYRNKVLVPYSQEDHEALSAYQQNQILRAKITGAEKPRSYEQLKLYWACCKAVADNLEDMTKEDVDFHVKITVAKNHPALVKRFQVVNGIVYMEPISIAYANMKHLEACKFFDFAFPILADMINIDVEVLTGNAKI